MSKAKEYRDSLDDNWPIEKWHIDIMNHKTLEDVKELMHKLPKYSHSFESIKTVGYMVRLSDVDKFIAKLKL